MSDLLPRRRMSREDRHQQLLDSAWQLIRQEGTEALTLGRLAELSGVTKPVVYDHFATRSGLFAALYQQFDARQNAAVEAALALSNPTLQETAQVIAQAYVECVLLQGRQISGILAALEGTPELAKLKEAYQSLFIAKCRAILTPFSLGNGITTAALWGMLGAAEALSYAAAKNEITPQQAQNELFETIIAIVNRQLA